MNRGWGTAVQAIELNLTDSRPIAALSRTELMALAAGEQPRLPVTIQGEAISQAIQEDEAQASG
jgi:phosphotransferase system HPr-like phosphotransfer protein